MVCISEKHKNQQQFPCSVGELLLHKPPMLLVGIILERSCLNEDNDTALVEATVPVDGPFVHENTILAEYLIEVAAQSIAAVDSFDARFENRTTTEGFLVGVDNFSIVRTPDPGDTLQIDLRQSFSFGDIKIYDCLLRLSGKQIGQGQIKIWQNSGKK